MTAQVLVLKNTQASVSKLKVVEPLESKMQLADSIRRRKGVRGILTHVTGSLAATVLLEQVLYWFAPTPSGRTKLRVEYDGHLWLAKSRTDMMADTGLTMRQYKSATITLVNLGIIEYRIGGFMGKPTPFFSLNAHRLRALIAPGAETPEEPFGTKRAKPLERNEPNLWHETDQTNTGSTTTITTGKKLAQAEPSQTNPEKVDMPNIDVARAILAHVKSAPGEPVDMPNSGKSLASIYRRIAPKYNDMPCIPPIIMKDQSFLKKMAASWGDRADSVMETICCNWISFAKHVATQYGFKSYPLVPYIPFIMKHKEMALAWCPVEETPKPVQVIALNEPEKVKTILPGKLKLQKVPTATTTVPTMEPLIPKSVEDAMTLSELLSMNPSDT